MPFESSSEIHVNKSPPRHRMPFASSDKGHVNDARRADTGCNLTQDTRVAPVHHVVDDVRGAGQKPGASLHTRKRLSLSLVDDVVSSGAL